MFEKNKLEKEAELSHFEKILCHREGTVKQINEKIDLIFIS